MSGTYSFNPQTEKNINAPLNTFAIPVPRKTKTQPILVDADAVLLGEATNNNNDSYYLPPPAAAAAAAAAEGATREINQEQIIRLVEQGFTQGLAKSLYKSQKQFPLRIWVVDNSGSMHSTDGHKFIETNQRNDVRMVECSRWEEIRECVTYHAKLAGLFKAPTSFRLLNDPGASIGPQQFGVAETTAADENAINDDVFRVSSILSKSRPGGCTPLTRHIVDIRRRVEAMAPALDRTGQRVAIVIATDGLPTDYRGIGGDVMKREFIDALRSLEGLPVWLIVRLCTDDDDVVEFYNELDEQLEISLEVLDDFVGEAMEVYKYNKWLNYALPLHRCREMGFHERLFDLIDERALSKSELRDFCVLLFGEDIFDGVADPLVDWERFSKQIEELLKGEELQWNPIKKRMMPLIDMKALNVAYGSADTLCGCCVM